MPIYSSWLVVSLASLALAASTAVHRPKPTLNPHSAASTVSSHSSAPCLDDNEISNEVRKLSSAQDYKQQAKIETLILDVAKKSPECRKRVISVITQSMSDTSLTLTSDQRSLYVWNYGSGILGKLKATEALDFLIAHFDLHDGTSFPLNHHPAMVAVVRMGSIALPKLSASLKQSTDPYLRRCIVFCMAWIGGASAYQELSQALVVENDKCVKSFMQASLAFLGKSNHIRGPERLKWYAAFSCNDA